MRSSAWSSDVCSSDLGTGRPRPRVRRRSIGVQGLVILLDRQVERMGGLNRGNGVFIHKLRHAVPFQQHAEQVIGGDLALQHHTIDQEHRDRMAGLANGVEENFLQKPWLTMRSEETTSELQSLMRISYTVL